MTVLLALVVVATLGTWIPLSQLIPGTPGRSLLVYVAVGNAAFSGIALLASGAHLAFSWRGFWLPLAGGVVWTGGNYCVAQASKAIGLARAAGTWTPLNIVVAFVWGALLFGELDGFSAARFAVLGIAFLAVVAGVLLIAGSREDPSGPPPPGAMTESGRRTATAGTGLLWAGGAGILWGTYFVPAQWARVPAQVSDFPLALGILAAALVLALPAGEPVKLGGRATSSLLGAGVLFGIGNLALLALVARVGTGTGFTIAQLSLLVNASVGVWVFRVPEPGTRQARKVLAGIVLAGIGGCAIAAMR
ncbi:MAG TPA: GRP family sugar transporter [Streptosporangiaceae bacterium]|jgi:glucose uptake protein|nr:GRP family sugar transporter [Streptosporangiaceae bacterium]